LEQYSRVVGLWQSYEIASAAALDKYLDSFRVLFAFHSGKIENEEITYYDTKEIFENGRVVNYTGSPRALFEQQNQKLWSAQLVSAEGNGEHVKCCPFLAYEVLNY